MSAIPPTAWEVGQFINSKTTNARRQRSPLDVTGRLINEVTELALIMGLSAGDIHAQVTDSLANQASKLSYEEDRTILPSKLPEEGSYTEALREIADVRMVLKDLVYSLSATGVIDRIEAEKWQEFITKEFNVSLNGLLYSKKPHIKN